MVYLKIHENGMRQDTQPNATATNIAFDIEILIEL